MKLSLGESEGAVLPLVDLPKKGGLAGVAVKMQRGRSAGAPLSGASEWTLV